MTNHKIQNSQDQHLIFKTHKKQFWCYIIATVAHDSTSVKEMFFGETTGMQGQKCDTFPKMLQFSCTHYKRACLYFKLVGLFMSLGQLTKTNCLFGVKDKNREN